MVEPAETAEAEAFRDLYAAGADLGAEVAEIGGAVCAAFPAAPAIPMLNHALLVGERAPADDDDVAAIVDWFRARGVRFLLAVTPHAKVPDLRAHGLEPGYAWTKFLRTATPARPATTDLRVERAGPERAEAWARTVVDGFGMPPALVLWLARLPGRDGWSCFLALDGDEPAAAGALQVTGALGWLGLGATLERFRRRGAQSAILAARVAEAADRGCETVATETGELVENRPSDSYRNILRAGFEALYVC